MLASGRNVNILVLDTEVYSNTGGQASKSTPRGAVAKFAASGKRTARRTSACSRKPTATSTSRRSRSVPTSCTRSRPSAEAEAYPGRRLVIAYSHCIEHGIEMTDACSHQKDAVESGYWPLYRYDPREPKPLRLDSKRKRPVGEFLAEENRFSSLQRSRPETAAELDELEQMDVDDRWARLEQMLVAQDAALAPANSRR